MKVIEDTIAEIPDSAHSAYVCHLLLSTHHQMFFQYKFSPLGMVFTVKNHTQWQLYSSTMTFKILLCTTDFQHYTYVFVHYDPLTSFIEMLFMISKYTCFGLHSLFENANKKKKLYQI